MAKETHKIERSAITGKFVRTGTAIRHPNTTVRETVKNPRRK